jgi:hypothetical protein
MFARIKKSGAHQYLQLVENRREGKKTLQRVVATIGRMDQLQAKNDLEHLIRSLSRFSEKVLLILSGQQAVDASAQMIGPALIFERLWDQLGLRRIIHRLVSDRKFGFEVERAIFLTVLHRLFPSGSDRFCDQWRRDYRIRETERLSLHHLYRAMAFLGEAVADQRDRTPFGPRCTKDLIEEALFDQNRDLFSGLDLVFLDTTSLYFEGQGGQSLGRRGHSKDHRPDLNQMVVGLVLDDRGRPVCCELWPGNTADVKTVIPVTERIRHRFPIRRFCLVADRGLISQETRNYLEQHDIPYILGARMRQVTEIREEVLSRAGRYREVTPEGFSSQDPAPLKVKEVRVEDRRYIVCLNTKQARKEAHDRQVIVEALEEQLRLNPKALIGNKGYRKYLQVDRDTVVLDPAKMEAEARFDGKWVLQTNTRLPADAVALKYKELWQVEQAFRDLKSIVDTRPIFHHRDETIRGHVFRSFLALVLKKELDQRLEQAGAVWEWRQIKQDLQALQEITIEDQGKRLAIRSQCLGSCGSVFKAVGVALPPTIREL